MFCEKLMRDRFAYKIRWNVPKVHNKLAVSMVNFDEPIPEVYPYTTKDLRIPVFGSDGTTTSQDTLTGSQKKLKSTLS
ncbi:hypothetical protein CU097_008055 [Rhizopus azygosporus]|uniref:Uncharacterized protein n=1 Tax=Rhizopus azygosporus TaxID=86630 RepID=A0A367JB53_RHIAZ|nr:hypothetical protein CU097_008055 [Rhizopus azygosporus]